VIIALAPVVYVLCAATAAACAFLLLRSYRKTRVPLLLWSGICFIGLTLNNVALILDQLVFVDVDLWALRMAPAVFGACAIVYGLVWETDT
jgi:hypothetical protein